ncbi:macro domain-containing protein [Sodalis glossinidius]|uniref:macro domain-containing protein n=1 Tax=Sodalis glossinidius TaxID=63612 RepID=UPI0002D68035|nr:macro domain-containing protein [Sodalis glossinidius]
MRSRIQIMTCDITTLPVEGIVNAANQQLMGGVDGAIYCAAWPALREECAAIRRARGGCAVGEAVITGGVLPVRHVIIPSAPSGAAAVSMKL